MVSRFHSIVDLIKEFSDCANLGEMTIFSNFLGFLIEKWVKITEKTLLDGDMNDPYNGSFTDGTISLPLWD
jgi:hypothetical protein